MHQTKNQLDNKFIDVLTSALVHAKLFSNRMSCTNAQIFGDFITFLRRNLCQIAAENPALKSLCTFLSKQDSWDDIGCPTKKTYCWQSYSILTPDGPWIMTLEKAENLTQIALLKAGFSTQNDAEVKQSLLKLEEDLTRIRITTELAIIINNEATEVAGKLLKIAEEIKQ
jgi:hypothetical protein